ncbi:MAG TPA: hypothetical protein DD435_12005 [Cyanobacteria bacterium UBA8530]|nr:hypothetical protein [Cyanobacteria bacterium UBA8530]
MKALALLLIGAIGISGCARLSDPYRAMLEKSYSDDVSLSAPETGLRNRVIAIDAGHGGAETGAKGPGGLLEKDVNLGVALALSRMLEKAGAKVVMTRSDDSPLVSGKKEYSTRVELQGRIELVNQAQPDLFLSIHHNASLDPASKGDETQTYYRLDDSGASLDAARSIHRSLVAVLGLPRERLFAGNYLLLRSSRVPAVLGEASFISNAVIEKKLSLKSSQELEAKAYFLGIADYFEKGVPQIQWLNPLKSPLANRPVFEASFIADAVPLDPSSIRVTLDERPIPFFYDSQRSFLSAQPEGRLSNEKHLIRIEARNVLGNSARALNGAFLVSDPPSLLEVSLPFPAPPKEGPLPIQARVLDAGGFPVRDGTPVKWKTTTGFLEFKESRTIGGIAMNYLTEAEKDPVIVSASSNKAKGKFLVPNKSDHVLFGQVLDTDGKAIAGALVTAVGRLRSPMTRSNAEGFFWIYPFPSGLEDVRVEKGGYRLAVLGARKSEFLGVELLPAVSASLSGKNIVLAPQDGPEAWKNWQVASFLEGYLKVAGAKGVLTHQPDQVEDAPYGVLLANRLNADLFLSIGRNALKQPVMAEHYPGSVLGKQLSGRIADIFGSPEETSVRASSFYPLVQAACPAVSVLLGEGKNASSSRLEAYRLFLALTPADPSNVSLRIKVVYGAEKPARPASNASLFLDESWPGQTDEAGQWVYKNLPPGQHFFTASDGLLSRGFWVLDLKPGEQRTLEVILDRPEIPSDFSQSPHLPSS